MTWSVLEMTWSVLEMTCSALEMTWFVLVGGAGEEHAAAGERSQH